MSKNFLPDYSDADRLQILKDSSDHIEETTYYRDLSEHDIDVKNESFVANSIEMSKHDAELSKAKLIHKTNTKPLAAINAVLLEEISTRKEMASGLLFGIADHELGVMNTFDEKGEFISSRRLRPDERQTRMVVHPGLKAAND